MPTTSLPLHINEKGAFLRLLRTRPHGPGVPDAVDTALDAAVGTASHALKGKSIVDALDGAFDRESDALGATLDGSDEVVDVALPVVGA